MIQGNTIYYTILHYTILYYTLRCVFIVTFLDFSIAFKLRNSSMSHSNPLPVPILLSIELSAILPIPFVSFKEVSVFPPYSLFLLSCIYVFLSIIFSPSLCPDSVYLFLSLFIYFSLSLHHRYYFYLFSLTSFYLFLFFCRLMFASTQADVLSLIRESLDNWRTRQYDWYQQRSNNILM